MLIKRNTCETTERECQEIREYVESNRGILEAIKEHADALACGSFCIERTPGLEMPPRMKTLGNVWYNRSICRFQTQFRGYDFTIDSRTWEIRKASLQKMGIR